MESGSEPVAVERPPPLISFSPDSQTQVLGNTADSPRPPAMPLPAVEQLGAVSQPTTAPPLPVTENPVSAEGTASDATYRREDRPNAEPAEQQQQTEASDSTVVSETQQGPPTDAMETDNGQSTPRQLDTSGQSLAEPGPAPVAADPQVVEVDVLESNNENNSEETQNEPPSAPEPPEDNDEESSSSSDDEPDKPAEDPAPWAGVEEDTSVPDEEELKMIDSSDSDRSSLEYDHWEKEFYSVLEDPEYKPKEKARVTWKISGVRGTKQKPNMATIMRSPAAFIGGYYWTIKFFPRGNGVNSLSIYIECSRLPPSQDGTIPDTEFKVLKGPPDAVLSDLPPALDVKIPAAEEKETPEDKPEEPSPRSEEKVQEGAVESKDVKVEEPVEESTGDTRCPKPKDWRVSADIGVVLYNPDEPRTGYVQSSCHQFNIHNVDWGWTSFHGPWDQIHKRQHGQRQALLRNDTLAFDAYIRILDDPTQSLWWHSSDSEPVWDSRTLVGIPPMGDGYSHSNEMAGLIPWLLLRPFRQAIESVDVLEHLKNCEVKPRPLCEALQKMLWQMREDLSPGQSVSTEDVVRMLRSLELPVGLVDFWEKLRRGLDLELQGTEAGKQLSRLFDSQDIPPGDDSENAVNLLPKEFNSRIRIPVDEAGDIQTGMKKKLQEKSGQWSLPPVLQVEVARQKFDKATRRWKMAFDRVEPNEELDLSEHTPDGKYRLYGFIVHKGKGTTGKFKSILRPGGPDTRWLAFQDGEDNRIECLTKKEASETHQGLDPSEITRMTERSTHKVVVAALYVRDSVVLDFLPGRLEAWELSDPLKGYMDTGKLPPALLSSQDPGMVQIEAYVQSEIPPAGSLFDTYDLMSASKASGDALYFSAPESITTPEVKKKLAAWKFPDQPDVDIDRIRLWALEVRDGMFTTVTLPPDEKHETNVYRLWVYIMTDAELDDFTVPKSPSLSGPDSLDQVVSADGPDDQAMEDAPPPPPSPPPEDIQVPAALAESRPEENTTNEDADQNTNEIVVEDEDEQPREPTASHVTPDGTDQATVDVTMTDSAQDEAAIAALIASDLEEMERAEAGSQTQGQPNDDPPRTSQPPPNPPSMPPLPQPPVPGPDVVLIEPQENGEQPTTEQTPPPPPPPLPETEPVVVIDGSSPSTPIQEEENEPKRQLHSHIGYFIQKFDPSSQTLPLVGFFVSKREDNIQDAVKKAMDWPEDKELEVWQRFSIYSIVNVSSTESFKNHASSSDGGSYVVCERLTTEQRNQLTAAGSFSSPAQLLPYLWAAARNHPENAFTGNKTIEPSFSSDYYSGEFKNGFYHGQGTHIAESGDMYEGAFVLGKRHGKGQMTYFSGDTYAGDWVENERHGEGTYVESRTGNRYVGGYRHGKRHGKGISYWEVADEEMDLCQICYGDEQNALFYDCGHVCACVACARQVDTCPICRRSVISVVRVFKT